MGTYAKPLKSCRPTAHQPHEATVLGFDTGKDLGFGAVVDGKLFEFRSGDLPKGFLRSQASRRKGRVAAVVEHHTPYGKWGMKAYRTMQQRVGQIQGALMAEGIPFHLVDPGTWQSKFGITGVSKQRKRMSVAIASNIAGRPIADHNAADAILIAMWGAYAPEVFDLLKGST